MKRSFSLKELQSAIDEQHSNASKHSMVSFLDETDSNAGDPPGGPPPGLVSSRESLMMRKSKSMTSFSDAISDQMLKDGMRPKDIKLLPLTSMVIAPSPGPCGLFNTGSSPQLTRVICRARCSENLQIPLLSGGRCSRRRRRSRDHRAG